MWNFEEELNHLREKDLWRELKSPSGLDFSSNDYLGLSQNPQIRKKLLSALEAGLPLSASASPLIRGYQHIHEQGEYQVAQFLNRPSSLFFSSGFSANEGIVSTLCSESFIFSDALNHASLIHGIRLSRSPYKIYRHNDLYHLKQLLDAAPSHVRKIIITESLFSMDGDFAPLKELLQLSEQYDAQMIVDEAHATGVFGPTGAGCLSQYSFNEDAVISIHTCGKALGAFGAFIGCSQNIRSYLINRCPHFIYSTSLSPLNILHIVAAIETLQEHSSLREQLHKNIHYALDQLKPLGNTLSSSSQIIPLVLGSNHRVLYSSNVLRKAGFDVRAIRSPTVPQQTERLRFSIHANHTQEQMDRLIEAVSQLLNLNGGELTL